MGRIVSIDFGLKRIGIAMSDQNCKLALPLTVVEGGKKAIQNIKKAIPIKEISLILVGLPLELSGKAGSMAQVVMQFAKQLEEAVEIPVQLVDERLSSKGAEVHLKEISLNGKQRREKIDMVAATLLLQTYLDQRTNVD
jgi:putative Holliday junction resolvase